MRIGGKIGAGVVVLGLVLSTTQAAHASAPPQPNRSSSKTITLITGDQVTLHNETTVSVRPGKGREKMTFSRYTVKGHTYVIPTDAGQLVATGQMDERLFDLTTLVEFGYDDARSDSMPLIVTQAEGRKAPRTGAAAVSRELSSINGVAMSAKKTDAGAVWESLTDGSAMRSAAAGVSKVWLDGKRRADLDRSTAQIGAPGAWAAGYTGARVKIAVLDTGVDQTHPDLARKEVAERNFSAAPDAVDRYGHGTHVASIAAGTGKKSGGKYRGVAPGALILDGKVLDDGGWGTESEIVAGMEWAAQQGADIANLSLGGGDTASVDPLEQAVETLTAQYGILFVIAAGNYGSRAGTIASPGSAPSALTVGAVDRADALADFSSRGPVTGDNAIKPDITAPGVGIVAALHSAGVIAPPVSPGYGALSGTSMATPHVAGAAALVLQKHPTWTGQQLKSALAGSAKPSAGLTAFEQGAGRADLTKAMSQTVISEAANVNLGVVAWPHDDDQPVSKSLTYRNLGTADVTLNLSVAEATGPGGAATNVFSLSANQVTVPAGGTAAVTVTGDAKLGPVDGVYSATVLATAGTSVTRTPVAITREDERYSLTLNYVGRDGQPTDQYRTMLIGLDSDTREYPYEADGSVTVRLPKGRYVVDHLIIDSDDHLTKIAQPGLVLDRDQTFTIDAATAQPNKVTPPNNATLGWADLAYQVETEDFLFSGGFLTNVSLDVVSTGQIGDAPPGASSSAWVSTFWSDADQAIYGLAWFLDRFPSGFTKVVNTAELAKIRRDYGVGAPGDQGVPFLSPQPVSGYAMTGAAGYNVALPGSQTLYVTTENVRWRTNLWLAQDFYPIAELTSPLRTYQAGQTYDEPFNRAVFGPGLPPNDYPWASRSGDAISVGVPLFTDSGGNTGSTMFSSGTTKLYRGGQLVAETPYGGYGHFPDLPAAAGDYRLLTEAAGPQRFGPTSAVGVEWTFSSAHVDSRTALPLNVVRYTPKLDANNSAPRGQFLVPMQVQDETGATFVPRQLTVEVSYDEGHTWQKAQYNSKLVAKLTHPTGASTVSLRATATDNEGNTVKQVILRAYTLR